jgi:hypothetical protein
MVGIACIFNALNILWRYLTQAGACLGEDAAQGKFVVPLSALAAAGVSGSNAMDDSLGIGLISW